ncbi:hypothetical protein SAMN04488540_11748 [Ferrimonas sediminum]|uniref:Lipoprotein n=1 Tax=Ferrimonas sediminum TaxID=718193 RepID=A0A1G8YFK2_9GAMM|nr:hypothetical protein [Ferrimonas sediminum]SDK01015.1 hypothetical protein SAMN04488540_11748 [Ferrimonas sediminum]
MKFPLLAGLLSLLLCGCAADVMTQFELGGTTAQFKQQGILDPDAVARNAGKVSQLDGQYGTAVMDNYRKATYQPEAARSQFIDVSLGGSGN